jgi:small conductance mechanosensitive channel
VGDWVEMDNAYGRVLKISWLTTALENVSGQEVFVPNQIIYSNTFTNFTTFGKRRAILRSSVPYASDLEHVKSITMDEVKKGEYSPGNEEVDFYYTTISDSRFNFEVSFWVGFNTENDYQQAMSDTIMRIKKRFENEKIALA